jgi:hypothetical protein
MLSESGLLMKPDRLEVISFFTTRRERFTLRTPKLPLVDLIVSVFCGVEASVLVKLFNIFT